MAIPSPPTDQDSNRSLGWPALGVAATALVLGWIVNWVSLWERSSGFRNAGFMLAAAVIGASIGVVFAVPRLRETQAEGTQRRYHANSNLEEISDWLTKILVGAGLVSLQGIPGAFERLGSFLSPGETGDQALAASTTLYGLGVGFLGVYMWARLRLNVLLEESEVQASQTASRLSRLQASLAEANDSADDPEPASEIPILARDSIAIVDQLPTAFQRILWVDDHPSNNSALIAAFDEVGIRVDLAQTTSAGIELLNRRRYDLVITDLNRPESPAAGADLVQQIHTMSRRPPVIVYTRRTISLPGDEGLAGAMAAISRPTELFNTAIGIIAGSANAASR